MVFTEPHDSDDSTDSDDPFEALATGQDVRLSFEGSDGEPKERGARVGSIGTTSVLLMVVDPESSLEVVEVTAAGALHVYDDGERGARVGTDAELTETDLAPDGGLAGDSGDDSAGEDDPADDPWANVKSEDELRASSASEASETDEDDAAETDDPEPDDPAAAVDADPAPPDPDEGFERPLPDDVGAVDALDGVTIIGEGVSCTNCAHFQVCAIISGVRPMLDGWQAGEEGADDAPIDPEHLARICDAYDPVEEDDGAALKIEADE